MTSLTYEPIRGPRVLAIDPITKGFGFAVLEAEPLQLVDWGVRYCRRERQGCASALDHFIRRSKPTVVVFEDWRTPRRPRAQALERFVESVGEVLVNLTVPVTVYSREAVGQFFLTTGARTKAEISRVLATRFPELAPRVPRPRQPWETEASAAAIFDAVALALTHLARGRGQVALRDYTGRPNEGGPRHAE